MHQTTRGLDPAHLRTGEDLALGLDPAHGLEVEKGVLADDHLDAETRWQIHHDSMSMTACCREPFDDVLTIDGVCLPWIWELDIERALVTLSCQAEALRRAVNRYDPASLVVASDADDRTRSVAAAVAEAAQIPLSTAVRKAPRPAPRPRRFPTALGARHVVVRHLRRAGIPSYLRSGSVVLVSYWPLTPLLDRMLLDDTRRPAVMLQRPPSGPARTVRAGLSGGWIGAPGSFARRRAAMAADVALACARHLKPAALERSGLQLGKPAGDEVLVIAHRRAAGDIANMSILRRAFRQGRPAAVLASWDSQPDGRLIVTLAKESGIRTLVLAHGAFLLPQTVVDMEVCDEPVLWSPVVAPPMARSDRPTVHVVGYPVPYGEPPLTRTAPVPARARIVVLSHPAPAGLALNDARATMRQYAVALGQIIAHNRCTTVLLRPHPAEGVGPAEAAAALFPDARVEVDAKTPILDVYSRCDLCIGSATTASLQAALVGVPLIALNLTDHDWGAPLDGGGTVPVARDARELAVWLDRWSSGTPLPGRAELLAALGASPHGDRDPARRILAVLDGAR